MDGTSACSGEAVSRIPPDAPTYSSVIYRLNIQAKVRQLGCNPSISDCQVIERECNALTALFPHLKHTQEAAGVGDISPSIKLSNETLTIWDETVDESMMGGSTTLPEATPALDQAPDTGPMNIEEQIISLLSNGNVTDSYRDLELSYSHVI